MTKITGRWILHLECGNYPTEATSNHQHFSCRKSLAALAPVSTAGAEAPPSPLQRRPSEARGAPRKARSHSQDPQRLFLGGRAGPPHLGRSCCPRRPPLSGALAASAPAGLAPVPARSFPTAASRPLSPRGNASRAQDGPPDPARGLCHLPSAAVNVSLARSRQSPPSARSCVTRRLLPPHPRDVSQPPEIFCHQGGRGAPGPDGWRPGLTTPSGPHGAGV